MNFVTRGPADPARAARFEEVFGRVYEPLQRYVRRRTDPAIADDVISEALTVIWRRLDDIPDELELAWSYSVARHCLANARRSNTRRLRLVDRVGTSERTAITSAAADSTVDDTDPELAVALTQLGPDDREVLHLWAWEQLEAREIGEVLGISANAASIRLHRAKGRLRDVLAPERPPALPDTDGPGPGGSTR
jgi:RNA polymerase sigma-70 factor, ECF subfamily